MLPTGADSAGTLVLTYKDGIATLVISKRSHGFCYSEYQTEDGTLRVNNLGEWSDIEFQKKGGAMEKLTVPGQAANNMVRSFPH